MDDVPKARFEGVNRRVLRRAEQAKVALEAERKKRSEGGCILNERLEEGVRERYNEMTREHHATSTWKARRTRIQRNDAEWVSDRAELYSKRTTEQFAIRQPILPPPFPLPLSPAWKVRTLLLELLQYNCRRFNDRS